MMMISPFNPLADYAGFEFDQVKNWVTPPRLPDLELYREQAGQFAGYLHRWCLEPRNKQRNVYLHHILSADENMLHDHPWWFESTIITGGYLEETETGFHQHNAGESFIRQATDLHRIAMVSPNTWTLITTGPVVRDWGFMINGKWHDWRSESAAVREVKSIQRNGYSDD